MTRTYAFHKVETILARHGVDPLYPTAGEDYMLVGASISRDSSAAVLILMLGSADQPLRVVRSAPRPGAPAGSAPPRRASAAPHLPGHSADRTSGSR